MRHALYPGSFDPLSNGHINIIKRALSIFDKIVVLVAINPNKTYFLDIDTRIEILKKIFADNPNIIIDSTTGLVVDYAKKNNITNIIRGIRNENDLKIEKDLADAYKKDYSKIEVIYLLAEQGLEDVSSTNIKKLVVAKKDISNLVPLISIPYILSKSNDY